MYMLVEKVIWSGSNSQLDNALFGEKRSRLDVVLFVLLCRHDGAVWSGSNTPVIQGRHIRAQSESERAASSPGAVPVGPRMSCLSFLSRRRRPGYCCPYTCIVTMLCERPHLGHSIISPL